MSDTLKIYLDQMFGIDVAEALRGEGHDIVRASEIGQSRADDEQILQKAIAESRILITLNEHFGDWVILPLKRHPGVIRIKASPTTSYLKECSRYSSPVFAHPQLSTVQGSPCHTFSKACKMGFYGLIYDTPV